MPTLMLARMFGDDSQTRHAIVEKHPSLQLAEGTGDVPMVRLEPLAVSAEKHAGTQVLKQVRVRVLSQKVESEDVQEQYRQVLLEEGAQWGENNHGDISYDCLFGYLEVTVAAGGELTQRTVEGLGENPLSYPAFHFPPPEVVGGVFDGLLGSARRNKQRGFRPRLDIYGRSEKKQRTPKKLIPAFVAWHIGTQTGEKVPPRSAPAVARVLNENLLRPLGWKEIQERQIIPDDTVWRDVKDLYPRFVRLQQFIRFPSHRGSPLITDI
jgi:hypothetical protein